MLKINKDQIWNYSIFIHYWPISFPKKKKKGGPSEISLTFKGISILIFLYFETKRAEGSIVDFIDGTQIYIDTISTQTPNTHDY